MSPVESSREKPTLMPQIIKITDFPKAFSNPSSRANIISTHPSINLNHTTTDHLFKDKFPTTNKAGDLTEETSTTNIVIENTKSPPTESIPLYADY
jgi:hypothetical protein|tara:strand:+ start:462 stop:749 length:288 start_codon:yes stop_codon:yes gene_type:complete